MNKNQHEHEQLYQNTKSSDKRNCGVKTTAALLLLEMQWYVQTKKNYGCNPRSILILLWWYYHFPHKDPPSSSPRFRNLNELHCFRHPQLNSQKEIITHALPLLSLFILPSH